MIPLYLCYFTFGFCMSFGSIAVDFEMMEDLKFTPVEMTMGYGIIAAPWCIKPFFGWISDTVPVFDWGKRRPYIFFCGMLLAYFYTLLPKFIVTKSSMLATMTAISMFMCFADVCADCITVDLAKVEKVKGKTQGSCWTARALGSLTGSSIGGIVYDAYGTKAVFQMMAIPSLLMALWIWQLEANRKPAPRTMCKQLWEAVYDKRVLAFSILLMSIGPNYGPFYTFFLRKELKFTPDDFQWISTAAGISFLCSTFIYQKILLSFDQIKLMKVSTLCYALCQLIQLIVVSKANTSMWIIVLDTVANSLFGMFMLLPMIIVVAHNANAGIEGTFYALMMSVSNLSGVLADELGGLFGNIVGVTRGNFDNMYLLIITCTLMDVFLKGLVLTHPSFVSYFGNKDHMLLDHSDNKDSLENNKDSLGNNRDLLVNMDSLENNRDSLENNKDLPVNDILPLDISDIPDSAI